MDLWLAYLLIFLGFNFALGIVERLLLLPNMGGPPETL